MGEQGPAPEAIPTSLDPSYGLTPCKSVAESEGVRARVRVSGERWMGVPRACGELSIGARVGGWVGGGAGG